MSTLTKNGLWKWVVTIFVPLAIMMTSTNEVYTPEIRLFFAITATAICFFCFEFFPMMIGALILSTVYLISGLVPASVVLQLWTNTMVYMLLAALLLGNIMEETGLLKRICYWCIAKCGGTFNGAMYGYFFAGILMGIVSFNNVYLIVVMLALGICKAFGIDKPCKESAVVVMVGCMASCGPSVFTYNPLYLSMAETATQMIYGAGTTLPWYTQSFYLWPYCLACLITIWLLTKINKTKNFDIGTGKTFFADELKNMGSLSITEKKCAVVILMLMAFLFTQTFHGLPAYWGFLIAPILLYIPGIKVGTDDAIKKLNIGVMVFIVACMSIGTVGTHLGVTQLMAVVLAPMLQGLSPFLVCIFTFWFGAVANVLVTPLAMLTTLSTPLCQIASSIGMDPMPLLLTLYTSMDVYFFPHEVTAYLLIFGFGYISMKDFVKYASLKTLVGFVVFVCVQLPFWYLMGIM